MKNNKSRKCAICRRIRREEQFPKKNQEKGFLSQSNTCFICLASLANEDSQDDGSGGGKQLQHSQDAKNLQYALELEANAHKKLETSDILQHNKSLFQLARDSENEKKTQTLQRELLEQLEEDKAKRDENEDEPNPDIALDTQSKRKKMVHLFSVTRSLANNRTATNNQKTAIQKAFSIFSLTKEQQATTEKVQQQQKNIAQKLSTESSTLFSAKPSSEDNEKLKNALRAGQNIFNRNR